MSVRTRAAAARTASSSLAVATSSGKIYRQHKCGDSVGEPDALPQATWLHRVAEMTGLGPPTGPNDEQAAAPLNWAYDMALNTRRIRTELKLAQETSLLQALVRPVLWERKA